MGIVYLLEQETQYSTNISLSSSFLFTHIAKCRDEQLCTKTYTTPIYVFLFREIS